MISAISGLPGTGKNVYATYLAKKHFKRENNILKKCIRYFKKEPLINNNVYTSFPIILKHSRKGNLYSNVCTINDLDNSFKFKKNALIIIDEVQSFYDSDEFKDFPKNIAVFNQFHRHYGVKDIYYISQHPSRIVKKLRNVTCKFMKIRTFLKIPIINIGIMYYTNYYEFDDYGKYHHPPKEMKTYDCDNHFIIFRLKPIFKAYNSTYLSVLNEDKPLLNKSTFNNTFMSREQILQVFGKDFFK